MMAPFWQVILTRWVNITGTSSVFDLVITFFIFALGHSIFMSSLENWRIGNISNWTSNIQSLKLTSASRPGDIWMGFITTNKPTGEIMDAIRGKPHVTNA